jgi:uroporphyrinogen decarboxylase
MTGRSRVWATLKREPRPCPPKGEILIDERWLTNNGFADLDIAIDYLQADLVSLPIMPTRANSLNWKGWIQKDIFLFGCLQGPVTFLSERDGWSAFSHLIIKQPLEASRVIAQFMDTTVQAGLTALDKGCDGLVFFDDLAGDRGLLINPKFLEDIYIPVMASALERLNSKDVPVIFHSDGNILSLISALRAIGFWGIQGLQPSLGIGPEIFRKWGIQDWVFWGNFEFEGNRRLKNSSEIQVDVIELLRTWGDFPGFIFGSSGGLYKGLSLPEIKLVYHTVANWKGSDYFVKNM